MRDPADLPWIRAASRSWVSSQTESLQHELLRMASMLAIQQTLHTQTDVLGIVNAALDHTGEIHPCDGVAVALVGGPHGRDVEVFVSAPSEARGVSLKLSAEEEAELRSHDGPMRIAVDSGDRVPGFLTPLVEAGIRTTDLFPMVAREQLCGILALGHRERPELGPDRVPYLVGFAAAVGIALSNARSVKESEDLAKYDSLTGLPNRRIFFDRLHTALAASDREHALAATCFIDLDGFKRVNDTMGHEAGDRVLRHLARRLESSLRERDSVSWFPREETEAEEPLFGASDAEGSDERISRLGGDEFGVLLSKITHPQDAGLVARRIGEVFERPIEIDGKQLFLSASIGIAVYPNDGRDADTLLRNADTAMYCAKKRGKNCFQYYTKSMNAEASRRLHIETRLRNALARNEFEIWYQPQRSARSGGLVGAEALVRWNDPDMGMVSPAEFIPLAEKTGCIAAIGEWVLRASTAQLRSWQDRGYVPIRLAVNLSACQLRQPDFAETVERVLRETGVSVGQLELEITETAIMEEDDYSARTLEELHALGIGLVLDDFGTGYSSLSYLRRFAIDGVKIDREFVCELPDNRDDCALTQAIIAMAHGLDLRVVAEGVETEEQARFLTDRGCDELQGFLFGRPVPAAQFEEILDNEKAEDDQ